MKRTAILMMALVLCLSGNCLAESILPSQLNLKLKKYWKQLLCQVWNK